MDQAGGTAKPRSSSEGAPSSFDLFVSYAREDRLFVVRLHDALSADGCHAWVDWEGIPASARWMAEVRAAIDAAGAFCFVISPDSVESAACREEAAHAAASNKRIIPVLARAVDDGLVPESVAAHNWIDFTDNADFDEAFRTLARAIAVDPERTRVHTRLLVRANEWEASGRDKALLLRGADLISAERWLAQGGGADLPPTRMHTAYILASRRQVTRRRGGFTAGVSVALAAALVLGGIAFVERTHAQREQREAQDQARAALAGLARARALGSSERAPDRALLLAATSWRTKPSLEGQDALMRAVQQVPQAEVFLASPSTLSDTTGPLALSPDQATLATGGSGGLRLWDVAGKGMIGDPLTTRNVDAVAFSPDGALVAAAGAPPPTTNAEILHPPTVSDDLVVWNVQTRQPVLSPITTGGTQSLAFSPDGTVLATAGYGGIKFWSTSTGQLIGQLSPLYAGVIAFSPDGRLLATAGTHGPQNESELRRGRPTPQPDLQLWDVATREPLGRPMASQDTQDLAFSPDGSLLAAVADAHVQGATGRVVARTTQVFDVPAGTPVGQTLETNARAVSFEPDGWTLITGGPDGLQRWGVTRTTGGRPLDTGGPVHTGSTEDFVVVGNGASFITAGSLGIVHWQTQRFARLRQVRAGAAADVGSAAGGRVVVGSDEHGLQVLTGTAGTAEVRASGVPTVRSRSLEVSADGRTMVVAGSSGITLWDVSSGLEQIRTITLRRPDLVALSPDGNRVAAYFHAGAANAPAGLWLWDVAADHQSAGQISTDADNTYALAFSRDGRSLAVAGDTGLQLWDVASGKPVGTPITSEPTWAVAFSPDGHTLAFASARGEVVFWDPVANSPVGESLPAAVGPAAHGLAFSPDASVLATVLSPHGLQLWNVAAREPLGDLLESRSVSAVAFSRDGSSLAAGGVTTTIWDLRPQAWVDTACAIANRNLTHSEWKTYVGPDIPYSETCPS